MTVLNRSFSLTDEPWIEPSPAQSFAPRGTFTVFRDAEALALAQFSMTRSQPPVLVVECDRGPGKGPHVYEGVKVLSMAHGDGRVEINTNLGPLYFEAGKSGDPDGRCVSRVLTLPEYFPMAAYRAFRLNLLRERIAVQAVL